MPRINCRSCPQASAQEAARRPCAREPEEFVEDMPMCRYSNPIPICPCGGEGCGCRDQDGLLLAALERQNQLLTDLLGAVNCLTAALLSGRGHPCG